MPMGNTVSFQNENVVVTMYNLVSYTWAFKATVIGKRHKYSLNELSAVTGRTAHNTRTVDFFVFWEQ